MACSRVNFTFIHTSILEKINAFSPLHVTFLNAVCFYTRMFLSFKLSVHNIFYMTKLLQCFHRFAHLYTVVESNTHIYETQFRSQDLDTGAAHRQTPSLPVGLE